MPSEMTIPPEALFGTWQLVRAEAFDRIGNPLPPPYGSKPNGRLALEPDGRMMAVLCDAHREIPEGKSRAYSSYCGTFRLASDTLFTTVDAAANPARIGSVQERKLELRDGYLVLIPPQRPNGEQRRLYWQRLCAAAQPGES